MTQVLLGRKASQSAAMLAHSMENARNTLTIQLDRLVMSIDAASKRADDAAKVAAVHERRMVNATRGLVFGTVLLAVATLGLVWYTRELALVERAGAEPTIAQPATR